MKSLLTFFILLGISLSINAQESIDIFTISGRYGFPEPYKDTYSGKATEYVGMVNLKYPVVFSENNIWYNDLTYTFSYVDNGTQMPDSIADPIRLNAFILQTGWVHRFDNMNAIQLIFSPRFMTDFINAGAQNFQFGGMFLYEKIFRDNLMMRFGALYNQENSGPFMVPLVHLDWRISPRWSISGLFPIYGKVNFQAAKRFITGISFFGLITSYKLGHPDYEGDYMERTSVDLALFGRYKLAGKFHIEGRFGYALGRKYAQYDADQKVPFRLSIISFGDNRVQKNVNFNSGPFVSIRLVYNLPLKD